MGKPICLAVAPVLSQSGYGKHATDLVRSLINLDMFDVKVLPIAWGNTPMNSLKQGKDDDILSRLIQNPNQLGKQPEVAFIVTIPSEYPSYAFGMYNIGVTAGIETTVCNPSWIEGCNVVNLNIVPSNHSKTVFEKNEFTKNDANGRPIAHIKLQRPMETLFEGADTNVYKRTETILESVNETMNKIEEDFCFLFVGHWLQGSLGNDRKDVGMLIKSFLETFKNKAKMPALVLKTSSATFSVLDREDILKKINDIRQSVAGTIKLPNIYLLHGQLSDEEMNSLYNHDKIKACISFTKGEGFGRPLLECTMAGKLVVASGWSGHVDFLDKDQSILLGGKIAPVDASAINDWIIKDAQWFTVDYNSAMSTMNEIFVNYGKFASRARKQMYENRNKFSLMDMQRELGSILRKYVPQFPEEVQLKLPIKKITLPKLKKTEQK
jgi:hypothetical protein